MKWQKRVSIVFDLDMNLNFIMSACWGKVDMSQCACGEQRTTLRVLFSLHLAEAKPACLPASALHTPGSLAAWLSVLPPAPGRSLPPFYHDYSRNPIAYKAKALPTDLTPSPIPTLYLKKEKKKLVCSNVKSTEIKVLWEEVWICWEWLNLKQITFKDDFH